MMDQSRRQTKLNLEIRYLCCSNLSSGNFSALQPLSTVQSSSSHIQHSPGLSAASPAPISRHLLVNHQWQWHLVDALPHDHCTTVFFIMGSLKILPDDFVASVLHDMHGDYSYITDLPCLFFWFVITMV